MVEVEPHIRCDNGLLRKPDLICSKDDKVLVIDVAVSWEGPNPLASTYHHKQSTYSSADLLRAFQRRYPYKSISVEAFVVGARGSWCHLNDLPMMLLGLREEAVKKIITATIMGSIKTHKEFMRSAYYRGVNE